MREYVIEIVIFVVTVCGVILTKNVIPYIKTLIKNSEYADIYDIVEIAVKSAEQKCNQPKQGKAKKADVYAFVSQWLAEKGIILTEDEIDRIIEAAVYSMNNE